VVRTRHARLQRAFTRQAKAFAHSPLQRDPARLARLLAFIQPREGQRVLDVGCGPGIVTATLARAGALAYGVDVTAAMLREARAAGAGGRYLRADVERLPCVDQSFDVTLARNAFHHLADPHAVAREMARVTRAGGRVVIEDMRAPDDPAQRAYHETIERLRDVSHTRTLTAGEMQELLAAAGLRPGREVPGALVIDFDEWIDRAYPAEGNRRRALEMMQACVGNERCGLRVWREGTRLLFERPSLIISGVRP
jgi:ubiquinone/menaquinone biosynthesis C-methylase UbiE